MPMRKRKRRRTATIRIFVLSTRLLDRKSTRLNSSHSQISYAVFCLKKKHTTPHHLSPCYRLQSHPPALSPGRKAHTTDIHRQPRSVFLPCAMESPLTRALCSLATSI